MHQAVGLNKNYGQIALVSTVWRTLSLFPQTGGIQKRKYPPNIENIKLTEFAKVLFIFLVIERPGIYLHEAKQLLLEYTGIDVQESTICKVLKSMWGISAKVNINSQSKE